MPGSRYDIGGLNLVSIFCYDEESRYRWLYTPRVALVSRLRPTEIAGLVRLFFSRTQYPQLANIFYFEQKVPQKWFLNSTGNY